MRYALWCGVQTCAFPISRRRGLRDITRSRLGRGWPDGAIVLPAIGHSPEPGQAELISRKRSRPASGSTLLCRNVDFGSAALEPTDETDSGLHGQSVMMALQQLAQVGADECPALETAGLGRGLGLFIGYRLRCGKCHHGWVVSEREDTDIRARVVDPKQVGQAGD